jgi:hypothetical protein
MFDGMDNDPETLLQSFSPPNSFAAFAAVVDQGCCRHNRQFHHELFYLCTNDVTVRETKMVMLTEQFNDCRVLQRAMHIGFT